MWLWWLTEPERLPGDMTSAMENSANQLVLSVASSWEIAIKYALGKLSLPEPPEKFVPARFMRDLIETLPIEHRHALHVATLPLHHRDTKITPVHLCLGNKLFIRCPHLIEHGGRLQKGLDLLPPNRHFRKPARVIPLHHEVVAEPDASL